VKGRKTGLISVLVAGLLAGSAVGVAAQDDEEAAGVTSFTGSFSSDAEWPDVATETELPNGFTETTGHVRLNSWVSSDPRLSGDVATVVNWVLDPDGFGAMETGGQPNMLNTSITELTNDGGSWLGEGVSMSSTDLDVATDNIILVGRDGYDGLTAYVLIDGREWPPTYSGVIFPSAMPDVPEEPYAGE
jgi:hypothetical protein